MLSRRRILQLAALSTLGSGSASVRAKGSVHWPSGLMGIEPLAHLIFGNYPLVVSDVFQISHGSGSSRIESPIDDRRKFDNEGVVFHIVENGNSVPIVVRQFFLTKLAIIQERYDDLPPNAIAVYQVSELFGGELQTRINLYGFSDSYPVSRWSGLRRIWALAERNGKILCTYVNLENRLAG